jgi:hypothetical protein
MREIRAILSRATRMKWSGERRFYAQQRSASRFPRHPSFRINRQPVLLAANHGYDLALPVGGAQFVPPAEASTYARAEERLHEQDG